MLFSIRLLIDRGLKPLTVLAGQVERINEEHLDYRVGDLANKTKELLPIEREINRLLERLEEAFSRIKRFSSDAAHELFTPISELHTLAEVGKISADDQDAALEFFEDVKQISVQMQQVVTDLLDLTKMDAGDVHKKLSTFPIAETVEGIWQSISRGSENHMRFVNKIPVNKRITTDRDKLSIVLRNILNNAFTYGVQGTEIRATIANEPDTLMLTIANVASDLEEEDLNNLTSRLWRKDESRTDSAHTGLGLALANSIATLLDLELVFKLEDGNIFCASIRGLKTEQNSN